MPVQPVPSLAAWSPRLGNPWLRGEIYLGGILNAQHDRQAKPAIRATVRVVWASKIFRYSTTGLSRQL